MRVIGNNACNPKQSVYTLISNKMEEIGFIMVEKGLDTTDVRLGNRYSLVKLLYQKKEATRQELLAQMHVSAPTFWSVLRELQELGLVVDGEQLQAKNGRKPMTLKFDYSARTALGIEIFGATATLLLTDLAGTILAHEWTDFRDRIPEGMNSGEFFATSEVFRYHVKAFLQRHVLDMSRFLGIGFALHGYVQDGQWIRTDYTIPVQSFVDLFDYPVFFGNAAHLSGFAEVWVKNIRDAVYLTVGFGVGGAIIVDGEVFQGKNNRAGDLGHFIVDPNGKKCICGRRGCLATRIGLYNLAEENGYESLKQFVSDLQAGEEKAVQVWQNYLKEFAGGICTLSSILDQDVLIGGTVVKLLRGHVSELKQAVESQSMYGEPLGNEIYLSDFEEGVNVPAVGAALTVVSNYLKDVY